MNKLLEAIGQYGVQCSETKELAPPQYLLDALDAKEAHAANLRAAIGDLTEENAALQARLEAADKQEPIGYWHQGNTDDESDFHLFTDVPHSDKQCSYCVALFTRPPITSERELELLAVIDDANNDYDNISAELTRVHSIANEKVDSLLAVIEQMRVALQHLYDIHGITSEARNAERMRIVKEALALIPDLSALKEHDARVLEDAGKLLIKHYGDAYEMSMLSVIDELCCMAEERRKP